MKFCILFLILTFPTVSSAQTYHVQPLNQQLDTKKLPKGVVVHDAPKYFSRYPEEKMKVAFYGTFPKKIEQKKWDLLDEDIFFKALKEYSPEDIALKYPFLNPDEIIQMRQYVKNY